VSKAAIKSRGEAVSAGSVAIRYTLVAKLLGKKTAKAMLKAKLLNKVPP
jgi:hypothetical protein